MSVHNFMLIDVKNTRITCERYYCFSINSLFSNGGLTRVNRHVSHLGDGVSDGQVLEICAGCRDSLEVRGRCCIRDEREPCSCSMPYCMRVSYRCAIVFFRFFVSSTYVSMIDFLAFIFFHHRLAWLGSAC